MLLMLNQVELKKWMRFKIQILNMSQVSDQVKILKRMRKNQLQKGLNKSQKISLRVGSGRAERGTPTKAMGRQEGLPSNFQKVYFYWRRW